MLHLITCHGRIMPRLRSLCSKVRCFVISCLLFCTQSPPENGSSSRGCKFFPCRVDPFSEGAKSILTELSLLHALSSHVLLTLN